MLKVSDGEPEVQESIRKMRSLFTFEFSQNETDINIYYAEVVIYYENRCSFCYEDDKNYLTDIKAEDEECSLDEIVEIIQENLGEEYILTDEEKKKVNDTIQEFIEINNIMD